MIDPDRIVEQVVADLEAMGIDLQRDMDRAWDDELVLDQDDVDELVERLRHNIRALCHVIDPAKHSSTVRKGAMDMVFGEPKAAE
jgi:hypothetical protein